MTWIATSTPAHSSVHIFVLRSSIAMFFKVVVLLVVMDHVAGQGCPSAPSFVDPRSYGPTCIWGVSRETVGYDGGNDDCSTMFAGARLVSPNSADVTSILQSIHTAMPSVIGTDPVAPLIGVKKNAVGVLMFADGETVSEPFWATSPLNNQGCATASSGGSWQPSSCERSFYGFICQVEVVRLTYGRPLSTTGVLEGIVELRRDDATWKQIEYTDTFIINSALIVCKQFGKDTPIGFGPNVALDITTAGGTPSQVLHASFTGCTSSTHTSLYDCLQNVATDGDGYVESPFKVAVVCAGCDASFPDISTAGHDYTDNNKAASLNDVVTFECTREGEIPISGDLTRTCLADNNWSGTDVVCGPKKCTTANLDASSYEATTPTTTPVHVPLSETLDLTCNAGFSLEDGSTTITLTCADVTYVAGAANSDTWTVEGVCTPITCALDSVPRLFNPLTPTSGETVKPYNVVQAAECISGYMPSNQLEALELKCIENNMWEISPAGHVCIPEFCYNLEVEGTPALGDVEHPAFSCADVCMCKTESTITDFTAYVRNSTSTGSFQVKCTYEVIDGDAICGTRVAVHHNTADPSDDWLRIDLSPESISSSLNGGNSIQTAISSTYMAVYHATMVKVVGDDQSQWWRLPYPRTLDSFWDSTDDTIIDDTSEQKSVTVRTRQSGETTVSEVSCLQNKQGIQRSVDDPSIVSLPATKDIDSASEECPNYLDIISSSTTHSIILLDNVDVAGEAFGWCAAGLAHDSSTTYTDVEQRVHTVTHKLINDAVWLSFPSVPVIETDDAGQSYTYISEDLRETLLSMAINEYEITATDIPLNIPTATFVFELISFCGGESYTEFIVGESVTEFRLTFDSNGRHILSLITSEGESRTVEDFIAVALLVEYTSERPDDIELYNVNVKISDCPRFSFDECLSVPCQNSGTCVDYLYRYECTCDIDHYGLNCEDRILRCEPMPCQNEAPCVEQEGRYFCNCTDGWQGENCTVDIDECASNPCVHDNTVECVNHTAAFECICESGFEGDTCSINHDDCETALCDLSSSTCHDLVNDYRCDCFDGWEGDRCTEDIDDCDPNPCQYGGACSDGLDSFTCTCADGYHGETCQHETDECASNPCFPESTCQDYVNYYECECSPGYEGILCGDDKEECLSSPCLNGGTCTEDAINEYTCTCVPGYNETHCENDIDDCADHECLHGSGCVDGVQEYTCQCRDSYTGQFCESGSGNCAGVTCPVNTYCESLYNGYNCYCMSGYAGDDCLTNIDECSSTPCLFDSTCEDQVNGYTCTGCPEGYNGTHCENGVDHCADSPCPESSTCIRYTDGYACDCHTGWTGDNCDANIDDCDGHRCSINAECVDILNAYTCECVTGFTGEYCETNINDCADDPCENGGTCYDLVAGFVCSCLYGYQGDHCETATGACVNSPCPSTALCVNTFDGHECRCMDGYTGDDCDEVIEACSSSPCNSANTDDCENVGSSYTCNCKSGYEGINCDDDIDECLSDPCLNGGTCAHEVDLFTCTCTTSYIGETCQIGLGWCADDPCPVHSLCDSTLHTCTCTSGWTGLDCDINIDECLSLPCQYGGTCEDGADEYECFCVDGTYGDNCELEYNECLSNPCNESARCVDYMNSYLCDCLNVGYTGVHCNDEIIIDENNDGIADNITTTTPIPTTQVYIDDSISCPLAEDVQYSYRLNEAFYAHSSVTYKCLDGFWFPDHNLEKDITCLTTGSWNRVLPACEVVRCPLLPLPEGVMRSSDDTHYQALITYTCAPGYMSADYVQFWTIDCLATGEWSNGIPECHTSRCESIDTSAVVITSDPLVVTYQCPDNQIFSNGRPEKTIECGLNGEWNDMDLSCYGQPCPPVPYVGHGQVVLQPDYNSSVVTRAILSCIPGYLFSDGRPVVNIECVNNIWYPEKAFICDPLTCPPVQVIGNATADTDLALQGTVVTYTCVNSQWFAIGVKSISVLCQTDLTWSPIIQACMEILCPYPDDVVNTNRVDTTRYVGGTSTYTCSLPDRLFLHGNDTTILTCEETGEWSQNITTCEPGRCPYIEIPNSDFELTNATEGVTLHYGCIKGYRDNRYRRRVNITCDSTDLTWKGDFLICEEILCPTLAYLQNILYSSNGRSIGDIVQLKCPIEYRLRDMMPANYQYNTTIVRETEILCEDTGEWDYDTTGDVCTIIVCAAVRPIPHASSRSFGNTYGDEAIHTCEHGYHIAPDQNNVTVSCNETAKWYPEASGCVEVTCPAFTPFDDYISNTTINTYTTTVNYTCMADLVFKNNVSYHESVCDISGEWVPSLQSCGFPEAFTTEVVEEASQSQVIGAVGGTVVGVPLGIMVLADALSLLSSLHTMFLGAV